MPDEKVVKMKIKPYVQGLLSLIRDIMRFVENGDLGRCFLFAFNINVRDAFCLFC